MLKWAARQCGAAIAQKKERETELSIKEHTMSLTIRPTSELYGVCALDFVNAGDLVMCVHSWHKNVYKFRAARRIVQWHCAAQEPCRLRVHGEACTVLPLPDAGDLVMCVHSWHKKVYKFRAARRIIHWHRTKREPCRLRVDEEACTAPPLPRVGSRPLERDSRPLEEIRKQPPSVATFQVGNIIWFHTNSVACDNFVIQFHKGPVPHSDGQHQTQPNKDSTRQRHGF